MYVRIGRKWFGLGLVALATAAATSAVGTAPASAGVTKTVRTLAPGLTFTKITLSSGPERIRILTIDPTKVVMVDDTLSAPTFGSFATVSSMATANGAIAAVNGDYGEWPPRPVHSFSHNGTLVATGSNDSAFAVSVDRTHSHLARIRPVVIGQVAGSTSTFTVNAWNTGKPGKGLIDGYTPVGGSVAPPPSSGCFARLAPTGGMQWGPAKVGVAQTYTVSAMKCESTRMGLQGDVVLAATHLGAGATTIQSLVPGTTVSLTWSLGSWSDVETSIGGGPMLVAKGKIVSPTGCGYLCSVNPRTGVGVTKSGKILLVTVDGRNSGWSAGMTLVNFAKEMKSLGAVNAMNLDGGGSTTMWTKKYGLVNRPTDCLPTICEREVSSAILILPRVTKGGTIAAPAVAPSVAAEAAAWQAMLSDPGSTGGYMQELTSGSLAPGGALPASDYGIAAAFRASAGSNG